MDKDLCFIINDEHLYLEISLIEFQDIPMFFICKSNNKYYVALCIDDENVEYILIEASPVSILMMLYSEIEMRDLYKKTDKFWTIKPGDSPEDDEVIESTIEHLDVSVLPIEGAKYEVFESSILEYRTTLERNIYNSLNFSNIDIKNILLNKENVYMTSQFWLDSFGQCFKTYKNISRELVSAIQLNVQKMTDKSIFTSSFEEKTKFIKNEIPIEKCSYNSTVNKFNTAA